MSGNSETGLDQVLGISCRDVNGYVCGLSIHHSGGGLRPAPQQWSRRVPDGRAANIVIPIPATNTQYLIQASFWISGKWCQDQVLVWDLLAGTLKFYLRLGEKDKQVVFFKKSPNLVLHSWNWSHTPNKPSCNLLFSFWGFLVIFRRNHQIYKNA